MRTSASTFRRGLMLSACFPMFGLQPSAVQADQSVVIDAATPVNVVNADIAAKIATPDRNLAISVTAPGSVTGGGTIFLFPGAGQGDGSIIFSNAGLIGAVDADGVITDFVGVQLFGNSALADNSLTATNSGLITNGFHALSFGGAASFSNSGTIYGGIQLTASGDASVLTTGAGTVATGAVSATSQTTTTNEVDGDFTTTVQKSGNATVVVSDAGTKDARSQVSASSRGTTDVTVTGVAGNVSSTANAMVTAVAQKFIPPAAGETVTTVDTKTTQTGGVAKLTLGAESDVLSAFVQGSSSATVTAAGLVANQVQAQTTGTNSASRETRTQDADGNLTEITQENSSSSIGGAATVTLAATADTGLVTASGAGGATVSADGKVRGGITATSSGTETSGATEWSYGKPGVLTSYETANASQSTGKMASISTGAESDVAGFIQASGQGGATVTVAGKAGSGVQASSLATKTLTINDQTSNEDGGLLTQGSMSDTMRIGGAVSATLASTGEAAGSMSASSDAGDATVIVEGKGTSASASTSGTNTTQETSSTYDGKGVVLTQNSVTTSTPSGGKASATVTETGSLSGSLSAFGQKSATASVAGSVAGSVSVQSTATATSNSSAFTRTLDSKGVEISTLNASTSTQQASGGIATVAVTDKGSAGSVTAAGDGGVTVTNAGTIAGALNAQSNRLITATQESSTYQSLVVTPESEVSESAGAYKYTQTAVGGSVSVTNAASGLIGKDGGSITANAIGGVTIVNDGTVRGTTSATSQAVNDAYEQSDYSISTTIFGTAGDPDVTTSQERSAYASSQSVVGGNVTGTYAGSNGTLNFSPAANGSVTQVAAGASTATVSGAIFGSLTSQAGQQTAFQSSSETLFDQVLDSDGNGSRTSSSSSNSNARGAGGSSSIVITGTVGAGNVGGGSVSSLGSEASTVEINGGTVDGSVSVNANGVRMNMEKSGSSYAQTLTKGIAATTSLSQTGSGSATTTAGAASAALNGVGTVGGNLTVAGIAGSTVTTSADSKVGGSVSAAISATSDSSYVSGQTYSRDSKTGMVASVNSSESKSAPATAAGNASATVAGTVGGPVSSTARAGTATTVVTGSAAGTVSASTGAAMTASSSKTSYSGILPASAGTSFGTLGIPTAGSTIPAGGKLEVVNSDSATWTGGMASVQINTAADLQTKGVIGAGSVSASGLGGATADITAGSRVSGGVFASSNFTNSSNSSTTTYLPASASSTSVNTQTAVGGGATVTNRGTVGGTLSASSIGGASVVNTGKAGSVAANALSTNRTTETVDSDITNAALRVQRTTVTTTAVGGTATISNAAGALVNGSVALSGKSGTFTNAGFVTGITTLGQAVQNATEVTTRTDASTQYSVTVPTPRFAQTYVVEQNGITRGFNVTGATASYTNAATGVTEPLRTSDITATINLNSGSVTLGDITAQLDPLTQERLTATTVNLKGSGWLGADVLAATPPATNPRTPSLSLSTDARTYFGTQAVRVTGVATVQKQDAGTFVIHGRELVRSTTPGIQNSHTMDVGQFTINGGEVQLSHDGFLPTSVFGIRGNLTNNATLVLGRRVPNQRELFGESIVGIGPETIAGITIEQVGNFTQGSSGVIVAAVRPSLVRAGSVSLSPGGSASEPLGPIEGGVSIPYFTTPENLGMASLASRVNVIGNLNQAGTVQAVVTRDSLFRDGDGYTLFTYTGTGAVSASVTPTIASPFVSFSLVNDATAKTVRLSARRSSFTAAATDLNAAAAAGALDSAVTDLTARILNDAGGGNGFGTVGELAGAQDLANIVSALDWRLSSTQAAELFQELSSAEIYGSLAAIDQNLVFGQTAAQLGQHLSAGQPLRTRLWLNPVGDFARFRGDAVTGASAIRSTAYGMAFGADIAFSNTGAFGFGGAYGEHDVTARTSPESARVRTWTIGAYASQGFGQGYVSAMLAYGFSRFSVERSMTLLSRSMGSDFRGTQFDAALEGGYNFALGNNAVVTPFAEIAVRSWHMNAASEAGSGGGGVAVAVEKSSKSVLSPTIGARIGGTFQTASNFAVMPHAKLSYTFQGDIGSDRTVRMLGGGNSFVLQGVDPGGFGSIEAGVETLVQSRFSLFVRGGYRFAGGTDAANVRGGISFNF